MARYDNNKLYIIIDEKHRDTFDNEVKRLLQCGCLPLGKVSNYFDRYGTLHFYLTLLKPPYQGV